MITAFVNDARVGVNYVFVNNGAADNGLGNFAQTFGVPGVLQAFFPHMSLSGGLANSFGNAMCTSFSPIPSFNMKTPPIITKGAHTMHVGFQGWRQTNRYFLLRKQWARRNVHF